MRRSVEIAALALALAPLASAPAASEPIALHSWPVALDEEGGGATSVGRLEFRGGIHITSPDSRFGGLSGLAVTEGGAGIVAISDNGYWITARLRYRKDATLEGISDGEIGDLVDPLGRVPTGKKRRDAESLAKLPDGIAVGFEGDHRIWLYPSGPKPFAIPPRVIDPPPGLARAPSNMGLEALTALPGARLFALTEGLSAGPGRLQGWIGAGPPHRAWRPFSWVRHGQFRPSGATALPGGDVLVLERRFTWIGGFGSRIVRIAASALEPGAEIEGEEIATLESPLVHDNFEGIGTARAPGGETLVYLVSDDNDIFLQRTLLLMFALRPRP